MPAKTAAFKQEKNKKISPNRFKDETTNLLILGVKAQFCISALPPIGAPKGDGEKQRPGTTVLMVLTTAQQLLSCPYWMRSEQIHQRRMSRIHRDLWSQILRGFSHSVWIPRGGNLRQPFKLNCTCVIKYY